MEKRLSRQLAATAALLLFIFILSGCAPRYDYTLHKPVVRFQEPSPKALNTMLAETHGKSYRFAEEGPRSFDCSGLTYYSYGSMNLWLPRTAHEQAQCGQKVALGELTYGDLIFFDTRKQSSGKINHVGVYVGNGKFTHASSSKNKVITTKLNQPYYANRIVVCKRVIPYKPQNIVPSPTPAPDIAIASVLNTPNKPPIDTGISLPKPQITPPSADTGYALSAVGNPPADQLSASALY